MSFLQKSRSRTGAAKVRVLVVDDSALVRTIIRSVLDQHPQIEVVGLAVDGVDALSKISALRPDVVTLDVEMPRLNGLGVLQRVAGKVPLSFVMISTLTQAGARTTFEALRLGAFDYVPKPDRGMATAAEFRQLLQEKVLAAAGAKGRARRVFGAPGQGAGLSAPTLPPCHARGWLVGIGISCGGPQTLAQLLPHFPSDFVPILITQHMPPQFTRSFASQLDHSCAMRVKEAQQGESIQAGTIYIAPGDQHLCLQRQGVGLRIQLDPGQKVSGHRPSADAMFASMLRTCAPRCVAVVMTGMGQDGAEGLAALRKAGCRTLAQDEETSLVYGMPKAAAETGAVERVVALPQMPQAVARVLNSGAGVGAG